LLFYLFTVYKWFEKKFSWLFFLSLLIQKVLVLVNKVRTKTKTVLFCTWNKIFKKYFILLIDNYIQHSIDYCENGCISTFDTYGHSFGYCENKCQTTFDTYGHSFDYCENECQIQWFNSINFNYIWNLIESSLLFIWYFLKIYFIQFTLKSIYSKIMKISSI